MKDLKCGLRVCKFNKGYSCVSRQISVNGNADCTSYDPDERKRRIQFEAANDFVPANYTVDTKIGCGAECIFNREGKCVANGITVMSRASDDASCLTFIKKS